MAANLRIDGPGAWTGSEIQNDASWIYRFDAAQVEEIHAALAHAKMAGARIPFARELFPLPRVAGLSAARRDRWLSIRQTRPGDVYILYKSAPSMAPTFKTSCLRVLRKTWPFGGTRVHRISSDPPHWPRLSKQAGRVNYRDDSRPARPTHQPDRSR